MIELKRVLVPIDFSEYSDHALRYACTLAEKFSAELHLLHVTDPIKGPGYFPPSEEWIAQVNNAAWQELEKLPMAELGTKGPVRREVREGFPFSETIRYARENEVNLNVMGTHGRTGLAHALLGSVAEKVVRKAPCPVR